jgi:hypothetical protein
MPDNDDYLVVLDFDGSWTLWPMEGNSHWSRMDNFMLDGNQLRATQDRRAFYMEIKARGEWSERHEADWLQKSIQAWIDAKLHRRHIAECFRYNKPHMRGGHREILERIKSRAKGRTYVVVNSYGIRDIIKAILEAEGVLHLVDEIVAMDLTYDAQGHVIGFDEATRVNWRIKQERTREIMARLGIPDIRTIGIGDTQGDANIVPDTAYRLLIASSAEHAANASRFFHDAVISPTDWSGATQKLAERFGF